MWITRKLSDQGRAALEGAMTDMGVATIGGGSAAVLTGGSSGIWRPSAPAA